MVIRATLALLVCFLILLFRFVSIFFFYLFLCSFLNIIFQCTWEGDNTVMALQTARYLVSAYGKLMNDEVIC